MRHFGRPIVFNFEVKIDQYDQLTTIWYKFGGQSIETKFKIRSKKCEYKQGQIIGDPRIGPYYWICRCGRGAGMLYLGDNGQLGCKRCSGIWYRKLDTHLMKLLYDPELVLDYMIKAKTITQKKAAIRLFDYYVRRMRKKIMKRKR